MTPGRAYRSRWDVPRSFPGGAGPGMAASLEICTLDMTLGGGACERLRELEQRISRLLRCEPGRPATELLVEGYVQIRNDVIRHVDGGFRSPEPLRRSVLFPGGGLVVLLEIEGGDCAATLRWDAPVCAPDPALLAGADAPPAGGDE